jgi:uncharacterized protein (TIGR03437 family)
VVSGSQLGAATSVSLGTRAASFVVNAAGQITVVVPSGATNGKLTVRTPGGTAVSAATFTVTP